VKERLYPIGPELTPHLEMRTRIFETKPHRIDSIEWRAKSKTGEVLIELMHSGMALSPYALGEAQLPKKMWCDWIEAGCPSHDDMY
jgi:hypothetical protein